MKRTSVALCSTLLLALFSLTSCDDAGGFGCGIQVPSCCYDTLFGCGTFDLPFGCSCRQFGLSAKVRSEEGASPRRMLSQATDSLTGVWSGSLRHTKSSCVHTLQTISGAIKIRQRGTRVTVRVKGYGTLTGRTDRKGFTAHGRYAPPQTSCSAQTKLTFLHSQSSPSTIRARVDLSCQNKKVCAAQLQGSFTKIPEGK